MLIIIVKVQKVFKLKMVYCITLFNAISANTTLYQDKTQNCKVGWGNSRRKVAGQEGIFFEPCEFMI